MIHQHIFASPRPGMSEQEFQDYWRYIHAIKYAMPIPQVKKYKIGLRINMPQIYNSISYSGVAEIWLNNEQEQAESLLTPEYIEGAKKDEKRWAAAWQTLVLDTDPTTLYELTPQEHDEQEYKIMVLLKRKEGMSLSQFRDYIVNNNAEIIVKTPGLIRNHCCFAKDTYYEGKNEPPFDYIGHFAAESMLELKKMLCSDYWESKVHTDFLKIADEWIHVSMATRSEWIIGPIQRT
jgi:hypothetical protein